MLSLRGGTLKAYPDVDRSLNKGLARMFMLIEIRMWQDNAHTVLLTRGPEFDSVWWAGKFQGNVNIT
jgi:hypothetical protein